MEQNIESRGVCLRKTDLPEDEPFLKGLFCELQLEDPVWTALDTLQRSQLLEVQYRAQKMQYAESFPNADSFIVVLTETDIGRLLVDKTEREIHCVDINILQKYRNRGIGAELLSNLLKESAASGRVFGLRVLKTNPAIHMYQRLGIEIVSDEEICWKMEWCEENGRNKYNF